jgi:hypothetical protein
MDGRLSGETRAGTFAVLCKVHFTSDLGDFSSTEFRRFGWD